MAVATPRTVKAEMPSYVAEILQYPFDTALAKPIDAGSLLTVATEGSDHVQTVIVAKSRIELSK